MAQAEEPIGPRVDWVAEHHRRYVESGGADGHLWNGVPTLLLTTRDRSGRQHRTPLIYGKDGDAYVVVASWGGNERHPAWYTRLRADPEVTIQLPSGTMAARATTATPEEKPRLWELMSEIWPAYRTYQQRTDREIPVVVIRPT
jgi:deazaflavin-dependent oxidoreductase (nitroreductase family)